MTMTLEQVRDELRRPWNQTSAFAWCAQLADAIEAHLSQPQPVAQGEAIQESCKLCFGRGERTADGSNGRRVKCNTCDGTGRISRPAKPVSQAEAVAWLVTSEKAGRVCVELTEIGADKAIVHVIDEYKDAYGKTTKSPLYATPTIPAGHRVVPVDDVTLREAAEEALDLLEHVDPEHGITTQLRRVLSAAPDAGGV